MDRPSTAEAEKSKFNQSCDRSEVTRQGQDSVWLGSQGKVASSKATIGAGKSSKISLGSPRGDVLSDAGPVRAAKSGGASSKVGESFGISDGTPHLVKWASGYDLPDQDPVSVDYQAGASRLGQRSRSRSSRGSVDDLLPSKSAENVKSRPRGQHNRLVHTIVIVRFMIKYFTYFNNRN